MIEGNRIKFGYSDIVITSNMNNNELIIGKLKKVEKYSRSKKIEIDGDPINFHIIMRDYVYIMDKIEEVRNRKITEFEFGEYIFDFSNYVEDSLDLISKHVKRSVILYLLC